MNIIGKRIIFFLKCEMCTQDVYVYKLLCMNEYELQTIQLTLHKYIFFRRY